MLKELFTYNPDDIHPTHREQMAAILKTRGEFMRASAEVSDLRARAWAGETGLNDLIELKAADLAKLRQDHAPRLIGLLKDSVDVDGLMSLVPMLAAGILQNFRVPLPVLLEALGVDFDNFKLLAEQLKDFINEE